MVAALLKRAAAQLPEPWQHEIRRRYFARQIRQRRFVTGEKEYGLLDELLQPGDWALDIGANVGHYTLKMSQLVAVNGRVIAFEPVPATFGLLTANSRLFAYRNVTLLNVAASDRVAIVGMDIPSFSPGVPNFYQARIADESASVSVLTLPVDMLVLPARIKLAKIDVEGHELAVLHGMASLLARDRPTLILETSSKETIEYVENEGYSTNRIAGSSNVVCRPRP
jgi:FkbM family methyltransferase